MHRYTRNDYIFMLGNQKFSKPYHTLKQSGNQVKGAMIKHFSSFVMSSEKREKFASVASQEG